MTVVADRSRGEAVMRTGPVYLYGIARSGREIGGRGGILGARVTTIAHRKVAAIASSIAGSSVRAKRRDLLLHSDVLQDAFAGGPVLPFRFGTVFPGEEALVDELLAPRHDELVDMLDRFDGVGELRLRAAYHDQETVLREIVRTDPAIARLREATQGRTAGDSRLLQLGEAVAAAFAERRRADGEAIVARLSKHADDVQVDEPIEELDVVRTSFLVREKKTSKFDELLESVALTHRHLIGFNCTGPVPPHSFVDLDGA